MESKNIFCNECDTNVATLQCKCTKPFFTLCNDCVGKHMTRPPTSLHRFGPIEFEFDDPQLERKRALYERTNCALQRVQEQRASFCEHWDKRIEQLKLTREKKHQEVDEFYDILERGLQNEHKRICSIFDEFEAELEQVDPNTLKESKLVALLESFDINNLKKECEQNIWFLHGVVGNRNKFHVMNQDLEKYLVCIQAAQNQQSQTQSDILGHSLPPPEPPRMLPDSVHGIESSGLIPDKQSSGESSSLSQTVPILQPPKPPRIRFPPPPWSPSYLPP